jgi:hypothetical protein
MRAGIKIYRKHILFEHFSRKNRIINKCLKRRRAIEKSRLQRENLTRELANNLWKFYGKEEGKQDRDWSEAEDLLSTYSRKKRNIIPNFRVINLYSVAFLISILSLASLVIHLRKYRGIEFDNYSLILFILVLTPFLSFILEKATLPGGLNLEFRKIQRQQYIQSKEIDDIRFLFFHFVTDYEKDHLRKLNLASRFKYGFSTSFEEELRRLLALKLIERHPGKGIRSAKKDDRWDNDLREYFYITDKGKEYLERIERFNENEEVSIGSD